MADLTLTATKVGIADQDARVRNVLAAVAVNGGVACYVNTNGLADLASAAAAGTAQFAGIAIPTKYSGFSAGVGQAVELAQHAEIEGFDLSALAYWAPVYLSDTAGKLSSTAGTKSVVVGRVIPTTERDSSNNPRKLLQISVPFLTVVT